MLIFPLTTSFEQDCLEHLWDKQGRASKYVDDQSDKRLLSSIGYVTGDGWWIV